jgi:cardiolipin synthase
MRRLPNLVTFTRLVLTPVISMAILRQAHGQALALLAVAGLTDALDGYLARRFGGSTRLGAYLDPIADKVLLLTVYISLGSAGLIPPWLVMIVVGRDLLILAFAGAALLWTAHRGFDPSVWGKLSTLVQIVTGVVVIASRALASPMLIEWAAMLPAITAITTAWSGLHYAWRAAGMLRPPRGAA